MVKVLLVDDDKVILKMLTRRFTKLGYSIDIAENGKIAVEKAINSQPDLVLMDMHMPIMDGYQAVKNLRQQGYNKLIVAFTASAMAEDYHKSLEIGCDYYISKPINREFEQTIQDILTKGDVWEKY